MSTSLIPRRVSLPASKTIRGELLPAVPAMARTIGELPLNLKLLLAIKDRKLKYRDVGKIFGVVVNTVKGWIDGPALDEYGQPCGPQKDPEGRSVGWQIPAAYTPLILDWIATGRLPTADEKLSARRSLSGIHREATTQDALDLLLAEAPKKLSADPTVKEVCQFFLKCQFSEYSERSIYDRIKTLLLFIRDFGERRVSDLKPLEFELWIGEQTTWKSPNTIHGNVSRIKRVLNWAADMELTTRNPFRKVIRKPNEGRCRGITDDEFRKLLRASNHRTKKGWERAKRRIKPSAAARFRMVLFFLRHSGARPGEMCEATWNDVTIAENGKYGFISLAKHKTAKTLKRWKPRIIVLDKVMVKMLQWIKKHDFDENDPHIFRHTHLAPWTKQSICRHMRRVRIKAGLAKDVSAYLLRHGFGSRAAKKGLNSFTIAELMGHSDTRMTQKYVHLSSDKGFLAEALRKVNEKINRQPSDGLGSATSAKPAKKGKRRTKGKDSK